MDLITDEIVEAAARALAHVEPGEGWPTNDALGGGLTGTRDDEYRDGMREQARAALEAAAPLIAGQALREARERLGNASADTDEMVGVHTALDLLDAEADRIEARS